ncbi:MAG: FAD-dependent oxidoreductase [Anaerolineae bacterium]
MRQLRLHASKAMIGSANAISDGAARRRFRLLRRGSRRRFPAHRRAARRHRAWLARLPIQSLEKRPNITLYRDYAAFEAPHSVRVGSDVIDADRIYLMPARARQIPPIDGLDQVPYLDNIRLMNLTELPPHLIILGGGYIGLEFAQAFRRFGSDVTVIDRSTVVIEHEDQEFLGSRSVHGRTGGRPLRIRRRHAPHRAAERADLPAHRPQRRLKPDRQRHASAGRHWRRPNSDRIGADAAGLKLDEKGYVTVDDHLRTSADGVYALGDVNSRARSPTPRMTTT